VPSFSTTELGAFAFRVLESDGPNAWFVLVVDGAIDDTARTLSAEISTLGEEAATVAAVTSGADLEDFAIAHVD